MEERTIISDPSPGAPAKVDEQVGRQDARAELARLLAASGRGDHAAFEQLYRAMSPKILALCMRMLRRRDLAEEVLQEVFVKIWRSAAEYDSGRAAPMTWMFRIARNRAIDTLRHRKYDVEADPELHDPESMGSAEAGPLEEALDWSQSAALRRCLDLLTAVQRDAVLLAFFRGFTHVELAGALAVPIGTVKGRIRQG
ncbi:MAG: sigma-70 family RNA polymerase sigma factor, partial [Myxococcales bacterium]|nr:sigma-70 family RNA polymerase sigma factor [Myxococcales bacterium]